MEPLLQFIESITRWLARGVVFLVWFTFPGLLLLPALRNLPDLMGGAAVVGMSLVFWRGIRTWPAGRRLTNAVLEYVVKD